MTKNIKSAKQTMEQMFLEREQLGDITFVVESQRIRAHRIVLAAQSPKYKAQFYGMHPDEDEIPISYVSAAAFNVFLQFFYKETIDLTMENIEMVVDLAKQSLVDEFVESCVNFLKDAITVNNNLCDAYRLANLYDIESLRLYCEQQISTNTLKFFGSDDFLHVDRDMLLKILKMDTLNCWETTAFFACIAWARAQCKRRNLDDKKLEHLRAALGDAIHQIRFTSFSGEEFAALHKSLEGFFTADETIELFGITNKVKDFNSKKFNPNPRTSTTTMNEQPAWTRECNRFAGIKGVSVIIDTSGYSNFSLSCNHPIRLHGFALGMHLNKADLHDLHKNLSVEVRHDIGSLVSFNSRCNVYQNQTRHDETMFIFEKPLECVVYFACSFFLPAIRPNNEFVLDSFVDVANIEFALGGKWVTRFFFDK